MWRATFLPPPRFLARTLYDIGFRIGKQLNIGILDDRLEMASTVNAKANSRQRPSNYVLLSFSFDNKNKMKP